MSITARARWQCIYSRREPIRSGVQKVTLHSKAKPTFAGVDPYNYYVDRNSDDNVSAVNAS